MIFEFELKHPVKREDIDTIGEAWHILWQALLEIAEAEIRQLRYRRRLRFLLKKFKQWERFRRDI